MGEGFSIIGYSTIVDHYIFGREIDLFRVKNRAPVFYFTNSREYVLKIPLGTWITNIISNLGVRYIHGIR